MKSLITRLAQKSLAPFVKDLLRHPDNEHRIKMEQMIEGTAVAYHYTPEGVSRDLLLGEYHLLTKTYEHTFGRKYENALHRKISQHLGDMQEIVAFKRRQIFGESLKEIRK